MKKRTKEETAEYQRNRRKGLNKTLQDASGLNKSVTPDCNTPVNVTPKAVTPCNNVTPCNTQQERYGKSPLIEALKGISNLPKVEQVKLQSYSPMMVGYVPPAVLNDND